MIIVVPVSMFDHKTGALPVQSLAVARCGASQLGSRASAHRHGNEPSGDSGNDGAKPRVR
jgi:hypothetical protein